MRGDYSFSTAAAEQQRMSETYPTIVDPLGGRLRVPEEDVLGGRITGSRFHIPSGRLKGRGDSEGQLVGGRLGKN